jgi:hypothetical protein
MIIQSAILKDNKIYTGRRHWNIIKDNSDISFKNCIQGFVNDKGAFLNREESAKEAFQCDQIKEKKRVLFSEDLY